MTFEPPVPDIKTVYKTATEGVTSSTNLQNDDHLFFPIAANEIRVAELTLFFNDGDDTGDFKMAWDIPSGATGKHGGFLHAGDTGSQSKWQATLTTAVSFQLPGTGQFATMLFGRLYVVNGATAGTMQLQWAQNTSDANPTELLVGSWLTHRRVA